nr:hemerythrin domain-containing protein [uncultured Desulfobacter sp.]
MTNIIEWDKKYGVDVPELDESRKQLMEMFNTLIGMKSKKGGNKDVSNLVTDVNDYSKLLFSQEEKVLGQKGYPDLDLHAKSHRRFIKKAIGLRREIADDVDNLSLEDILVLRDLLIKHFEVADKMFIPFLRIHNYVDECETKK